MNEPTRWRDLLALGLRIGLAPEAFWRTSLREWRALAMAPRGEALSRCGFDAIAARFPDEAR